MGRPVIPDVFFENPPYFTQSGLGLPERDYFLDAENPRYVAALEAYTEYITTLLTLAEAGDPAGGAERIIALETRFAEAHWPDLP